MIRARIASSTITYRVWAGVPSRVDYIEGMREGSQFKPNSTYVFPIKQKKRDLSACQWVDTDCSTHPKGTNRKRARYSCFRHFAVVIRHLISRPQRCQNLQQTSQQKFESLRNFHNCPPFHVWTFTSTAHSVGDAIGVSVEEAADNDPYPIRAELETVRIDDGEDAAMFDAVEGGIELQAVAALG